MSILTYIALLLLALMGIMVTLKKHPNALAHLLPGKKEKPGLPVVQPLELPHPFADASHIENLPIEKDEIFGIELKTIKEDRAGEV